MLVAARGFLGADVVIPMLVAARVFLVATVVIPICLLLLEDFLQLLL